MDGPKIGLSKVHGPELIKNQPDKEIGSYASDDDLTFEDDDDVFRRASNASQITHFSDELQRK